MPWEWYAGGSVVMGAAMVAAASSIIEAMQSVEFLWVTRVDVRNWQVPPLEIILALLS